MTEELAIEKYKLTLITALSIENPNSTIGMILIKISWMYRLLNNNIEELKYLSQALTTFENAYINENFPMYGLTRDSLTYLIGDLNRRLNYNDTALQWFSKVITTIGTSYRVKELDRTGTDLIKGNRT